MSKQGAGRPPKALHEYLPSGRRVTTLDKPIIWKISDGAVGPRFDAAGNIYVAEVIRPKGWLYPPEWKKYLAGKKNSASSGAARVLPRMYGSIVKFSPKGGMVHFPNRGRGKTNDPFTGKPRFDQELKTRECDYWLNTKLLPVKVTGAEWIHPGVGHVGLYHCNCQNMTFDVDEFGRVFFADLALCHIRVIDTGGNAITRIGGYGNADNCGPDSAVIDAKTGRPRPRRTGDPKSMRSPFAKPEIAMSWPTGVVATDRYMYVADSINRRLLRCRWTYAAQESCEVK
jgi:hypothetical protein